MHVVIVGCGRSGSYLAQTLDAEGDTVSVLDADEHARQRLPPGFSGRFITGDAMNPAVLEARRRAGHGLRRSGAGHGHFGQDDGQPDPPHAPAPATRARARLRQR